MGKTRIAVVRGGPSDEYEVSLNTGESVLSAINRDIFSPVDIVITKAGEWLVEGFVRDPQELLQNVDGVFLALHGTYGEDGTIQRLLDRLGVPYTGSGAFPSAIAMNKKITKDRVRELSLKLPEYIHVGRSALDNLPGLMESVKDLLGQGPYIVKPVSGGSSVGTVFVDNTTMLEKALRMALEIHEAVLIEEFIFGREATCGVIERFRDQHIYALPPVEIVPPAQSQIFDYTVKYDGSTDEICPGRFSREEKDEIERIAKEVHQALELSQYSRSDFIVAKDGIYFLEVNTLPGLTEESLMPKALDAVGCAYSDFISHLLTDALEGRRR